ncbi:SRPBCC domain-containing protein [Oerskovia sp. Sa1BUA8]|uniref:SRPBCC domain-containing protein n=1 Tax=Oerskovia douganii TaxID=2762210 RepID=A0A9D5U9V3_9CELL|nr:SRPBCC domain-containing protein [Oerskovia douganii]MBE7699006.1 SRPBCC domain-containing protein [Oerskovia douganii]
MTTTDQQASIDTEAFQVTRTLLIHAAPPRVWAALTQDDLIARWFGQQAVLPDLRVGGEGTFGFDGYGQFAVRIEEYDEPRTFAFTWTNQAGAELSPDNSTLVRFTLTPEGEDTVLAVVESGFERLGGGADDAMASNRSGWTGELDELVAFLADTAPATGPAA